MEKLTKFAFCEFAGGEDQIATHCIWGIDFFSRRDVLGLSAAVRVGYLAPVEYFQVK